MDDKYEAGEKGLFTFLEYFVKKSFRGEGWFILLDYFAITVPFLNCHFLPRSKGPLPFCFYKSMPYPLVNDR